MKIKKQELSQLFYITNLLTIVLKVIYETRRFCHYRKHFKCCVEMLYYEREIHALLCNR